MVRTKKKKKKQVEVARSKICARASNGRKTPPPRTPANESVACSRDEAVSLLSGLALHGPSCIIYVLAYGGGSMIDYKVPSPPKPKPVFRFEGLPCTTQLLLSVAAAVLMFMTHRFVHES